MRYPGTRVDQSAMKQTLATAWVSTALQRLTRRHFGRCWGEHRRRERGLGEASEHRRSTTAERQVGSTTDGAEYG